MKLKPVLDSLEGVPEAFHELYTQREGKFMLELDGELPGFVPRAKLDEFRNNNVTLMKELETLKGRALSQEELDEFKRIREERQKMADKELLDKGEIDKLIEQRTSRMRADYEKQIQTLSEVAEELESQLIAANETLAGTLITAEISKSISSVGALRKGAMDDVISRAQRTWTFEDGKIVPKDPEGTTIFGKDGKGPMTMAEWCQSLAESAPYLFESSSGGGAQGGSSSAGSGLRTIPRNDPNAFAANLEGIAKGEVQVR